MDADAMNSHQQPDLTEVEALLTARLRDVFAQPPVEIPKEVDEAIVTMITERAGEIHNQRVRRWRLPIVEWQPRYGWAMGAATAILVVALAIWWVNRPAPALRCDIDDNGTVDIVDAYLMARRVQTGAGLPTAWDFNHDGRVDVRDVNLVARRSVAISGGGS
jgi:Dockerin type I domain